MSDRSCDATARNEMADLAAWSKSPYRGLIGRDGGFAPALQACLSPGTDSYGAPLPSPVVFLLSGGASTGGAGATGEPVEDVCARLRYDPTARRALITSGVLVILGDDRGLTENDEAEVERAAASRQGLLFRVCLGPDVLFTNQCVVLVHHYLDKLLHSCEVRAPRKMDIKR